MGQDAKPKSSHRSRFRQPGGRNMVENKGKPIMNGNSYAKELEEMPDFSNN